MGGRPMMAVAALALVASACGGTTDDTAGTEPVDDVVAETTTTTTAPPSTTTSTTTTTTSTTTTTTTTTVPPDVIDLDVLEPEEVMALAVGLTGERRTFTVFQETNIGGRSFTTIEAHILDLDTLTTDWDFSGTRIQQWTDGDLSLLAVESGPWIQTLEPAGRPSLDASAVTGWIEAYTQMIPTEVERDDESVVYEMACTPEIDLELVLECDPRAEARFWITVDLTTGYIVETETFGLTPILPGQWEQMHRFANLSDLQVDEAALDRPEYTTREFECLARALGESADDEQAMRDAIEFTTTSENQRLFTRCNIGMWPPGLDLTENDPGDTGS